MKIEDLELHLISDGVVHVDPGGPFGLVPRVLYAKYYQPDDRNLVPEALTCLFVRSEGKNILIDTGLGSKLTEREQNLWNIDRPTGGLVEGLARHGISTHDIDLVIDTHLHWDHCGGNTFMQQDQILPVFPNAEYLVQRMEWADASHPDARTRGTYFSENFAPLLARGQLRLLHGDTQVTSHIRCVVTPGHTRGHQSVVIDAGDWRGLFVSDMASFAIHMARTAWVTAFDVEPLENIRTKQRWQRWAVKHDAWLFFIHDPQMPVARLISENGRLQIVPRSEAVELIDSLPNPQLPRG
jgi:glyoxylase-like metal-dependent hydrolase (beta-lactamase superfamily II)